MGLSIGGGVRSVRTRNAPDIDDSSPWEAYALCRDYNGDDWFPVGTGALTDLKYEEVRKVCNRCPVSEQCLQESLERGDEWGMFGGLTPNERKAMRAPKPTKTCLVCDEQFEPSRATQSTCTPCQMRSRASGVTQLDAFLRKFSDELEQACRAGVSDKAFAAYLGVSHHLVGRARAVLGIAPVAKGGGAPGAQRRSVVAGG
jgi:WhiB family redox-sensing transcriptional regulator